MEQPVGLMEQPVGLMEDDKQMDAKRKSDQRKKRKSAFLSVWPPMIVENPPPQKNHRLWK